MKIQGDPELDFFDQNPQLRYSKEIQDLLKKESKKKKSN